jgi:hypothetical protein
MSINGENPKDPLKKTGPEYQQQLFKQMCSLAAGFAVEDIIGASINLFVNGVRQGYADKRQAEARYVELTGRYRQTLLDHYDSVTGKRRSIFPFDQVLYPAHFTDKDGF